MTRRSALSFVKRNGIVLESARGPLPNLAEAVADARAALGPAGELLR